LLSRFVLRQTVIYSYLSAPNKDFKISSVCSPIFGADDLIVPGVWDNLIGIPSCVCSPAAELSNEVNMSRSCNCGCSVTSSKFKTAETQASLSAKIPDHS